MIVKANVDIELRANDRKTIAYAVLTSIAIIVSASASYLEYFFASAGGFNSYQAIVSLVFWVSALLLILQYPFKKIKQQFFSYIRSIRGILVFSSYLSVHLLVYGFILEGMVVSLSHEYNVFPIQASLTITSLPIYPASVLDALFGLFVYPNISITVPPFFAASLALYSIVFAVIIAVLVVTNIMKATELKDACSLRRKSTAFVALPLIGVIGGASCCLSLPIFLALLAAPAAVFASPSTTLAYYVTYFLFPPATVVALKLNLDSINRIGIKLTTVQR